MGLVELSSGLVLNQDDIGKIAGVVVGHIEANDELSIRLTSAVTKALTLNPDLGTNLIEALENQFPQSVLSKDRILKAREEGWVIIEPYTQDRLNTSSYDVSPGQWFYTAHAAHMGRRIFNPYNPEHVNRRWRGPFRALTAREHLISGPFKDHLTEDDFVNLEMDDPVIFLRPQEVILSHTSEFIGARDKATEMLKARSSTGRSFVSVCKDSGWGDVGYFNRWTMEIQNDSGDDWTPIVVGQPIAQMVFFRVNPILDEQYGQTGNYQTTTDLEELKKLWKPEMMLPKLKRKNRVI